MGSQTDGQSDRWTGNQTDGQSDRWTGNQTDGQAIRQMGSQTDGQSDRWAVRQIGRHTGRETDRQSDIQAGRHLGRQEKGSQIHQKLKSAHACTVDIHNVPLPLPLWNHVFITIAKCILATRTCRTIKHQPHRSDKITSIYM